MCHQMHLSQMYLNHIIAKQEKIDGDFIQWYTLPFKYLTSLFILAVKISFNCIQLLFHIKMDFLGNRKYYQELKLGRRWTRTVSTRNAGL